MYPHLFLLVAAIPAFLTSMPAEMYFILFTISILLICICTTIILLPAGSPGHSFIIDGAVVMSHRVGVVFNDNSSGRGMIVERRSSRMPSHDHFILRLRN